MNKHLRWFFDKACHSAPGAPGVPFEQFENAFNGWCQKEIGHWLDADKWKGDLLIENNMVRNVVLMPQSTANQIEKQVKNVKKQLEVWVSKRLDQIREKMKQLADMEVTPCDNDDEKLCERCRKRLQYGNELEALLNVNS